jgi:hypothetical protein
MTGNVNDKGNKKQNIYLFFFGKIFSALKKTIKKAAKQKSQVNWK